MPRGKRNTPQPEAAYAPESTAMEAAAPEVQPEPVLEQAPEPVATPQKATPKLKTIPMIRTDDGKPADVHPDEVEHMKLHGWEVKE